GQQRIGDRPRHGAKGSLVQHDVHVLARASTRGEVGDVALQERVPPPRVCAYRAAYFVEVAPVARREIIETHDGLPEAQQRLEQVGTDETGAAGHEPAERMFAAAAEGSPQPTGP